MQSLIWRLLIVCIEQFLLQSRVQCTKELGKMGVERKKKADYYYDDAGGYDDGGWHT